MNPRSIPNQNSLFTTLHDYLSVFDSLQTQEHVQPLTKLMKEITARNKNIILGKENDPSAFLSTLLDNLGNKEERFLEIFSGRVQYSGKCKEEYYGISKASYELQLPTLDVLPKDYYNEHYHDNIFLASKHKWKCVQCNKITEWEDCRASFVKTPEILIIRVDPGYQGYQVNLKRAIPTFASSSHGKTVRYQLCSGVFAVKSGLQASHYVAIIMDEKYFQSERCYVIGDTTLTLASLSKINEYPRLLFYRLVN